MWPPVTRPTPASKQMPHEFDFTLTDVVAPGTTRQVVFTIPDGESYSMTGFVESVVGPTSQSGTLESSSGSRAVPPLKRSSP